MSSATTIREVPGNTIFSTIDQAAVQIRECQHKYRDKTLSILENSVRSIEALISEARQQLPPVSADQSSEAHTSFMFLERDFACLKSRVQLAASMESVLLSVDALEDESDNEEAGEISGNLPPGAEVPLKILAAVLKHHNPSSDTIQQILSGLKDEHPAVAAKLFQAVPEEDFILVDSRGPAARQAIEDLLKNGLSNTPSRLIDQTRAVSVDSLEDESDDEEAGEISDNLPPGAVVALKILAAVLKHHNPGSNLEQIPQILSGLKDEHPAVAAKLFQAVPEEDFILVDSRGAAARQAIENLLKHGNTSFTLIDQTRVGIRKCLHKYKETGLPELQRRIKEFERNIAAVRAQEAVHHEGNGEVQTELLFLERDLSTLKARTQIKPKASLRHGQERQKLLRQILKLLQDEHILRYTRPEHTLSLKDEKSALDLFVDEICSLWNNLRQYSLRENFQGMMARLNHSFEHGSTAGTANAHFHNSAKLASLRAKLNFLESTDPVFAKRLFAIVPKEDFFNPDGFPKARQAIRGLLN